MPTFRQRAASYRSSATELKVPKAPEPTDLERIEESLQGNWELDPEGCHKLRILNRAERAERVEETQMRVVDLSPDQRIAYQGLCDWVEGKKGDRNFLALGGYAGTGKSTVISVFAREHRHIRIAFCAFTGKAANVLKQKLRDAGVPKPNYLGTIHRLIYQGLKNSKDEILTWKRLDYIDQDLIIVDEASMVSREVFDDMSSFGIPILAVGDHGQLAPVEGAFNLMDEPHLRLEKVHRQAENSPIISLASYVREYGELPASYASNEAVRFVDGRALRKGLESLYQGELTGPQLSSIALLCYTNSKRRMANALVRNVRWGIPDDAPLQENEILICLRNSMGLFNGMRSRVFSSRPHGSHWFWTHMIFDEDDIELKASLFRPQLNRNGTISRHEDIEEYGFGMSDWGRKIGLLFDYGYALTVHKSQGSSFKDAFILYERPSMVDDDDFRRWLYTAITRASERLVIVTK